MKIISPAIVTAMFMAFFMFVFVSVADAAFAGKKKVAATETVAGSNAETAIQAPAAATVASPASDTDTILLVILSFLLPPLAVYLVYDDAGTPFIVNVILTLLFWIPGVIHALYHVLK